MVSSPSSWSRYVVLHEICSTSRLLEGVSGAHDRTTCSLENKVSLFVITRYNNLSKDMMVVCCLFQCSLYVPIESTTQLRFIFTARVSPNVLTIRPYDSWQHYCTLIDSAQYKSRLSLITRRKKKTITTYSRRRQRHYQKVECHFCFSSLVASCSV